MSHRKMTAWGLEKMMVRVQAVTIILALLLCAAQLRDSSGDWIEISLAKKDRSLPSSIFKCIPFSAILSQITFNKAPFSFF